MKHLGKGEYAHSKKSHEEAHREAKEVEDEARKNRKVVRHAEKHSSKVVDEVELGDVKDAKKMKEAEDKVSRAGYPRHAYLFTKREPVGDYIENLTTNYSSRVPETHYKSLVSRCHEDKIISEGRGGMGSLLGSPMGVREGVKHGSKLPDMSETM